MGHIRRRFCMRAFQSLYAQGVFAYQYYTFDAEDGLVSVNNIIVHGLPNE